MKQGDVIGYVGRSGLASGPHLVYEWLRLKTGLNLNHVSYKGGGPSLADAASGQIPLVMNAVPAALPHVRAGRITQEAIDQCWARIGVVGLQALPLHGDACHWTQRAADWGLSAYDACYLDTALQQRLPLATKDRQLAEVARRVGVPLYLQPRSAKTL